MAKKMKMLGGLALSVIMGFTMIAGNVKTHGAAETTYFNSEKDAIVFSTSNLSGNFNPFYATLDTDKNIIAQTQINMITVDEHGQPVVGDNLPTVVKDFDYEIVPSGVGDMNKTVYTFVLKNGLKFSDGHPLTMNDVMFNIYEYLDPVYTGSSTMYSIDIEGLAEYRTQTSLDTDTANEQISKSAAALAIMRILELRDVFEMNGLIEGTQSTYSLDEAAMNEAIDTHSVSEGYINAVASKAEQATMTDADYRAILKEDYKLTLDTFKKELEADYTAAQESYDTDTAPYNEWKKELSNDLFKFFLYEGYIQPVYEKKPNTGLDDKTKIVKFENASLVDIYTTAEAAIEKVYKDNIKYSLNHILTLWGTAGTLKTLYTAEAIDILMHNQMGASGLKYPNITGIVSLGHTTDTTEVTVNDKTYAVAQQLNADGTPVNKNEHQVLQITVNGTDPTAIYKFGFTVAPAHYYSADGQYPNGREIDIVNNKFGVEFANSNFQSNVIQSKQHVEVPVGAGAYMATDKANSAYPTGAEFWKDGVVYFKRNENFYTVGSGLNNAKIKYMQYKEMPSSQVLDALESGDIHFGESICTRYVTDRAKQMDMVGTATQWKSGYGYIGINAGKVPDVHIRRAIMSAMETSLALEYYEPGTCKKIYWPMSAVSWVYPFEEDGVTSKPNGHDYANWTGVEDAKEKIQKYMMDAGAQAGDDSLRITFTLASASVTEHPTYSVFKRAAEILNSMGWDIKIEADSQAVTKFAAGSLEVWAGERETAFEPDLYQVYHQNSRAASAYAWGYREIKRNTSFYRNENMMISSLSNLIDGARSIMDQEARKPLYEEAMGIVFDLAVELPVYQRQDLVIWNKKVIDSSTLTLAHNYIIGLTDRVWEIDFVEGAVLPPDDSSNDSTMDSDSSSSFVEDSSSEEVEDSSSSLVEDSSSEEVEDSSSSFVGDSSSEEVEDSSSEEVEDSSSSFVEDNSENSSEDKEQPEFRWNKDMNTWEVSYDGGKTWIILEEKEDSSSSNKNFTIGGCGSVASGGELFVLLILGGVLLMKKQKKE